MFARHGVAAAPGRKIRVVSVPAGLRGAEPAYRFLRMKFHPDKKQKKRGGGNEVLL